MKTLTINISKIIVLLIAGTQLTFSQAAHQMAKVSGTLLDGNGKPVEFATVSLLKAQDSTIIMGTLSNEAGKFTFDHINTGSYVIKVTSIGFEKAASGPFAITPDGHDLTLAPVKMAPAGIALKTVSINASKPLIERNGDRTVINVEGSVLSAGNSAMDILERSPGVTIDKDDNISLNGKQGVAVMVNDKLTYLNPAQLATFLRSADGNTIRSIEIITNPSAKYDASGSSGIINIKLKKSSQAGTNGSIVVGAGYGKYGKDNETISLNHKDGNLNLFGTFSHNDNKHENFVNLRRQVTYGSSSTYFNQYSPLVLQNNNNSYRVGAAYDLSSKNTIGALVSGYFNGEDDTNSNNTYIGPNFDKVDSSLNTIAASHQKYHNISLNLNDTYKIDTAGQTLSTDLDYSKFLNNANARYNTSFFFPDGSNQHPGNYLGTGTPSVIVVRSAKADYTDPLTKSLKLESGLKFSDVKTDNNLLQTSALSVPYADINHFVYDEKIAAGYITLSKNYANFTVKAGLRAEYTRSDSYADSINTVQNFSKHYIDLFPSLFINRTIDDKNELNFSYGRRIDRPQYDKLNPFTYHFDPYTFLKGNPYLKPQYSNNFLLNYTYNKTVTLTLGYSHTKDAIAQVPVTDPASKIAYATQDNLQSQNSYTVNIFSSYTVTKWWEGNVNATGFYNDVTSNGLNGSNFSENKATFMIRVTETFSPIKGFKGELTSAYQSAMVYGVFNMGAQYWTDAGISHSFAEKKASIKLSVSDIFNTHQIHNVVNFGNDNLSATVKPETQVVRLTLTYNFGSNKIKAHDHESGAEDMKGRVKGAN